MNEDLRLLIEHLLTRVHHVEARQNELEDRVAILYMSDSQLAEHIRKMKNKQNGLLAEAFDLPMPKGIN